MAHDCFHLSAEQRSDLLQRYQGGTLAPLSYATVADYCDSVDHVPYLPRIQGDLKDAQRPAALKMILSVCPPGASLLEVGAGEPYVAQMLVELGYRLTVVDPYDGSGRGPTEFEDYKEKYPDVKLVREIFSGALDLAENSFDCIYSISVLEHVPLPLLGGIFEGVRRFLRPGGYSTHLVDHVLAGEGSDFHLRHLAEIVGLQAMLSCKTAGEVMAAFHSTLTEISNDTETFFLSPEGHNLWRGPAAYKSFPFRRVVSVHSCEQFASAKSA